MVVRPNYSIFCDLFSGTTAAVVVSHLDILF